MSNHEKLWAVRTEKKWAEVKAQPHGFFVPAVIAIDGAPGEPMAWVPFGSSETGPLPSLATQPDTTWMPVFTTREAAEAFAQGPADVVEFNMEVLRLP
jgi:hypothetical protein